jgi:Protein of unknown function (DUF4232)
VAVGGVLAVAGAAAALGLVLAGGPSTQRVTTGDPAASATGRLAAGTPSSLSTPRPTSTPQPLAPCRSGQLRVSVTPYGYGMGEGAAEIRYANTATTGCTLDSYPGITISSSSGRSSISGESTTPGRYLENQNLGSYPPAPMSIDLPPGAQAVSYIGWDGGASLSTARLAECVTRPRIESITLPGDTGVIASAGNLGMGVCSYLEAEPIQPASYRPVP